MHRVLGVLSVLLVCSAGPAAAQESLSAGEPASVVNSEPPAIRGTPVYRGSLVAEPGTWQPADATYSFAWLRDGTPIRDADAATYRPGLADIGSRLAVRVTASRTGYQPTTVTSAESGVVRRATLTLLERPQVSGVRRYLRTLTASTGVWAEYVPRRSVRWLRGGEPIRGATGRTYRLTHLDVGRRISVRVLAEKPGYEPRRVTSYATKSIGHRVPLRQTVQYHVETRGRITANLGEFRRQANASLNDPRGWRAAGVAFREVPSGGAMTLVLAEASQVPRFSSGCSAEWSCRVGRFVIINQMRWLGASASWWEHGGTLRGYRHMVVNHETGHWLGHGHRDCPARGALAPVMQQQSKSLAGCRHNPWPRADEWWTRR